MQQSRDVLLVVAHTEVLLDPVLHHGAVPHAGGEASSLRTVLDDLLELRQLPVAQTVRSPGRTASPEPLNTVDVIPTDPLVHGGQGHVQLLGQLRRRLAVDVAEHRAPASPGCQVGLRCRLLSKLVQLRQLVRCALRFAYHLAILRASHRSSAITAQSAWIRPGWTTDAVATNDTSCIC
jgi:hypothetical protein